MNILFIHSNYPGQFRGLAEAFGSQGVHDVRFLTARKDPQNHPIAGLRVEHFEDVEASACHPDLLLNSTEQAIRRGAVIQGRLIEMARSGFVPRLVLVHGGNGLGLLIKALIPDCTLIGLFEWYFSDLSAEVLLNRQDLEARNMVGLRNLVTEREILSCDAGVVPTAWQVNQFPALLRSKLEVIFEGIDTHFFQPAADPSSLASTTISGETGSLSVASDELLLTYATRGMEPLRGFPEFMRALPAVLQALPQLKVLIGGRDRCAYSYPASSHGGSWKEQLLDELGTFEGRDRIQFTGLLSYGEYLKMLQRTDLHCYFTRPYVTSWSLFEAAACGAPVLTNAAAATTGTIEPPAGSPLSTTPLEPDAMAEAIVSRLQPANRKPRHSYLQETFRREACAQQWEALLNRTLQQQKSGYDATA